MSYQEFKPHYSLQPFIDAYWIVKTEKVEPVVERILPDACVDIILNLGTDILTEEGNFSLKNGAIALVGTMTRYKDTLRQSDTHILGIRFKPLGFSSFYKNDILNEVANTTIEFDKKIAPTLFTTTVDTGNQLDTFFFNKLNTKPNPLSAILITIKANKGILSVQGLAKKHFTTIRQLERNFKQHLGITPKEYINFVRYQYAFETIKHTNRSFLDIAFETGFYDHSHLTNEIKKYSGLVPSQLK